MAASAMYREPPHGSALPCALTGGHALVGAVTQPGWRRLARAAPVARALAIVVSLEWVLLSLTVRVLPSAVLMLLRVALLVASLTDNWLESSTCDGR